MPSKPAWLERSEAKSKDALQTEEQQEEEEEEDYMSMAITEPSTSVGGRETYTQRQLRKQREAEARARVPSKAEREAAEAARREAALATSALDPSNKGFKMMAKLGYKPGTALGKDYAAEHASGRDEWNRRITEPLGISVKEDRGGIGMDSEKKRKFREQMEEEVKRTKTEQIDFRERVRIEREERRMEAQFHAAQKVAERLDTEAEEKAHEESSVAAPTAEEKRTQSSDDTDSPDVSKRKRPGKFLSQINILYRGLVRAREEKLLEGQAQRRRYESLSVRDQSLFSENAPRLPTFIDPDLDRDDKLALGRTAEGDILEVECDLEEDEELEAFNALSPEERLNRLIVYLREKYNYCFWCKYRYETTEMDGCPGLTEDDHD